MAEFEYKGIKMGGSKILLLLPLLGTLGGGLWGGFELYKDYMNMRSKIEKYKAPDLSGFDKKLAVIQKEMSSLKELKRVMKQSASDARDYARDIKNDLKTEIIRTEKIVESIEKRTKTVQDNVRAMIDKENDRNNTLRDRINSRMDSLDETLTNKMKRLEEETTNKIQGALYNPLTQMRR